MILLTYSRSVGIYVCVYVRVSGAVARPSNQYQKLQNITVALDALTRDGVKLVNIGRYLGGHIPKCPLYDGIDKDTISVSKKVK